MKDAILQSRLEIAKTASEMLDGSVSYIEGARRVSELAWTANLRDDADIVPFVATDSETDALPIGREIRKLWSPDSLEKLRPEISAAEKWAREVLGSQCERLVSRFSPKSNG